MNDIKISKFKYLVLTIQSYIGSWRYKSWKCRFGNHTYNFKNGYVEGKFLCCECGPLCPTKKLEWKSLKFFLLYKGDIDTINKIYENTKERNELRKKIQMYSENLDRQN